MIDQKLENTKKAVDELKGAISSLKEVLNRKKGVVVEQQNAYQNTMTQKNVRLEKLEQALTMATQKIETSIQKIDEVIKDNGSGNNSN